MSHGILVFYILVSKHGALNNLTFTSVMLQRTCSTDGTSPSYLTNSPLVCEILPFPPPDYIIIGPKNDVLFHFFFRYELAQLLIHNNSITIVVILVYPAAASI
jgi:hypothetical protein